MKLKVCIFEIYYGRYQLCSSNVLFPDFINFKIKEVEQLIDYWVDKYNTELQEFNGKIKVTNEAIAEVQLKYNEIKIKYDMRQRDIDEYREEQKIINEKREFEERQCKMSIKLQVGYG